MRTRLFLAPWWVQATVYGTVLAVFLAVYLVSDGEGWRSSVVGGLVSGVLFGSFMGWVSVREQARWRTAAGRGLDDEELVIVHRAASTREVPTDPRLRAAALRAVTHALDQRRRNRWQTAVFLVLLPVLAALNALDSWWWLVLVPVYLYGIHETWAEPRRLRARVAELGDPRPS